ncbi:MAG: hypothetical protein KDC53_00220 [Saprospiraceae bacterium]|nr:hypothetical protein [Saprospiraceae bacterium]
MRKRMTLVLLIFSLGIGMTSTGCIKNGCPAEIQAKKVKKKKSLKKGNKTNLFPKKMRKNLRSPKF